MSLFGSSTPDFTEAREDLERGRDRFVGRLDPIATPGVAGYREAGALLGLVGDRQAALQRFRETPGLQFAQQEAQRAIQRQAAATGMTYSGNVLAALQERSRGLAGQQFNTYLAQLGQFAQPGLSATQNIAGVEYDLGQRLSQLSVAEAQAEASNRFNLGGALGGALSGFSGGGGILGGISGAVGGALGGGGGATGSLANLFSRFTPNIGNTGSIFGRDEFGQSAFTDPFA